MRIPDELQDAIESRVRCCLTDELGARGLLLGAAELTAADADCTALGQQLLGALLQRCYPDAVARVEFEHDAQVVRIQEALAFGAVVCAALSTRASRGRAALCATFNLAIGLLDGICDADDRDAHRLLTALHDIDVTGACTEVRDRGWTRAGLGDDLTADYGIAFLADAIEVFFVQLHEAFPGTGDKPLRRTVRRLLQRALEYEAASLGGRSAPAPRRRLVECSRGTSVLPFEIIEALTTGRAPMSSPSTGTVLGEAMWLIDDLVDLCDDASTGALNGVLLNADLDRLLGCPDIASAASRAAEQLGAAVQEVDDEASRAALLRFVQRYAGLS